MALCWRLAFKQYHVKMLEKPGNRFSWPNVNCVIIGQLINSNNASNEKKNRIEIELVKPKTRLRY